MPDVKANPPATKGGTGGFLTQKSGPLPNWGWGAIVLGGALGYSLYKNHKDAATAAASSDTATQNTPGTNAAGSGLTPSVIVQNMPGAGAASTPPSTNVNLSGTVNTTPVSPGIGGNGSPIPITAAQAALLLENKVNPYIYQNGQYTKVGTQTTNKAAALKSVEGKGQLYAGPNNYTALTSGKIKAK